MSNMKQRQVALQLYRSILKAHKKYLPSIEMKQLGDAYVKSEFKVFKKVNDTKQLHEFHTSWNDYLNHILQTARKQQVVSTILDTTTTTPTSTTTSTPPTTTTSTSNTSVTSFGKDLPIDMKFSEEQLVQLNNLKHEATKK